MRVIVTGGAGFIGSCIVQMLNSMGLREIIVVDNVNTSEKWKNLRNKKYESYYHKSEFLNRLPQLKGITHIVHMGACSATTELDFDYLYKNNFEYTKTLWNYATEKQISFIYASSAATYGAGENGFDDKQELCQLMPLNRYGYSKQLFDEWSIKQTDGPKQHIGLKFFNVYGPNEYAKGSMASMVYHGFIQAKEERSIKLFKSYRAEYADGGQLRDFIYVKDICSIVKYFLENEEINGIYNLGTGHAESFKTLAISVFEAMNKQPEITYIEMPEQLKGKYQYYTQAEITKLREVGYNAPFMSIQDGVKDYVQNYLMRNFAIY